MAFGIGEAALHDPTSMKAYQGIFLFLGAFSLAWVPVIWFMLPNSPATAKFLRNGDDRLIALERIRENNTGTKVSRHGSPLSIPKERANLEGQTSKWKWPQFWEAMRDPKTWMWTTMFL